MDRAVSIVLDPQVSEPVRWAADHLNAVISRTEYTPKDNVELRVAALPRPNGDRDGFTISPVNGGLLIEGLTERGIVYALTELAERIRLAEAGTDPLRLDAVHTEKAVSKVRGLCRFFSSETEDKAWLYDEEGWRNYFTMLVRNRFSRFSLGFGLGYNYPYYSRLMTDVYLHFAYPFLVAPKGYDVRVEGLSDEERDRNLRMLRFIAREAARRGLEFQLALWTHGYDFDDVPLANYQIRGIDKHNHAEYCRDALTTLLAEVPDITGVTFRVHVECGVPEGSYDFWRTVFSGLKDVGRPLSLDLHAKGIDQPMIRIGLGTGLPLTVSPKLMAEHTGLPYHQASVRRRETNTDAHAGQVFSISEGTRRFLRYGYGDLFATDRAFEVLIRVWPGTQRVLLSADPALAAGYGRAAIFAGAIGMEFFEPMSMKGRMGSGRLGQRFGYEPEELRGRYDWSKYEYGLLLLGRLAFDPDAPAESWRRWLRHEAGTAAAGCEAGLAAASRILPLVTQVHAVSACNNTYWPEVYDNMSIVYAPAEFPYGYDSDGATRFGDVPTFDPQLFANPKETVQALWEGAFLLKYTALDVACWLDRLAAESEAGIAGASVSPDAARPAVRRFCVDARIQAGLGRFFAARLRSACAFELYLLAGSRTAYERTRAQYVRARDAWAGIVQAAEGVYQSDLAYGVQPWLRGAWRDRLPAIERDIHDMDYWWAKDRDRPVHEDRAREILARMNAHEPPADRTPGASLPAWFGPGRPLDVTVPLLGERATLFWRNVNQAFSWSSASMERQGEGFSHVIPASDTDGGFPLQIYVVFDEGKTFMPGLGRDLCSSPYVVAMPAS